MTEDARFGTGVAGLHFFVLLRLSGQNLAASCSVTTSISTLLIAIEARFIV